MKKNELVADVAERAGLSKSDAGKAVDAVFTSITNALKSGDDVRVTGFGTFVTTERAASKGRDPRTGKEIDIKAAKVPKFRAGKPLKDELN
jgi:DNA-binding protein HU-beta